MKKNKTLLIIFLLLLLATAFLIFSRSNTTIRKDLRDFAVKDTAAISKIFLADRNGNEVTLERKGKGEWILNGKYEPKYDLLKFLLDGIYKIDIRSQVAKAAYNNVIKALASSGIKCEIYLNGKDVPYKTYYVGGQTEDAMGTFMMLENSASPFITEVPGFSGYLTPRFSTNMDAWRQTALFKLALNEIKSVNVEYANYPDKSFSIVAEGNSYSVYVTSTGKQILPVDSVAIENYLTLFSNVYFETWAKDVKQTKIDSILQYPPFIKVNLTDKNNSTKEINLYPMPVTSASLAQTDSLGHPLKYDLDRMYGYVKPDNNLVIVQHYTFDILLRQISDFSRRNPVNR